MASDFGLYSQYYDLLYKDKNYEGEASYIRKLLGNRSEVLELGCGTGKHASLLAAYGYNVVGVERSESMLAIARQRESVSRANEDAGRFSAQHGDARTFRTQSSFDAVVSLFHVASYHTTNSDLLAFLETAASHLRPGGVLIFDVWYGPAVLAVGASTRVKFMEDESIRVIRVATPEHRPNENIVEVRYSILVIDKATGLVQELAECHPMRYYFRPELELFAQNSGFRVSTATEWMTSESPSQNTWGVVFVFEKL